MVTDLGKINSKEKLLNKDQQDKIENKKEIITIDFETVEKKVNELFLEYRRLKEDRFKKDNIDRKGISNFYYSNDYSKFLGGEIALKEVLDFLDDLWKKENNI